MSRLVCFDLEGPLSPEDNAYDVMSLIPGGDALFERISRYDDLLYLQRREGYEAGDTLALIVPFLLCHGIQERDISALAGQARLVDGAAALVSHLRSSGWKVFCISTSYEQFAFSVTHRVGITRERVACTRLPLDSFQAELAEAERLAVADLEGRLLALSPQDDAGLKRLLDHFYEVALPPTALGRALRSVKPVGGARKAAALRLFAGREGVGPGQFAAVGDSITDCGMLELVNGSGGLAIAFNGNEYILPCATVAVASSTIMDLAPLLELWERSGREAVRRAVQDQSATAGGGQAHCITGGQCPATVIEIHRSFRRLVRRKAAGLG